MSEKDSTGIAVFGDFAFDLASRELKKFGTRLRLEDKPAQLLCLLLENRPNLLTRAQLHASLWPDDVHLDRDHGVNKCVNQLRLMLGDDPTEPRFIETLRGRGYRFIGDVHFVTGAINGRANDVQPYAEPDGQSLTQVAETSQVQSVGDRAAVESAPWHRFHWRTVVTLAAVLLACLVLRWFWVRKSAAVHPAAQPAIKSVVIGTDGAIDPPDNGFQAHYYGHFTFKPLVNRSTGGADRIETEADQMGYFYRSLTPAEKQFVLQRDWKLTCICAVKQGAVHANVDFGAIPGIPRFDIELLQDGDRFYVALTKVISPAFQPENEFEFPGAGDTEHPHTFELRYDHKIRAASLWIDGDLKVPVYHGVQQFREDRGLIFGVLPYRDSPMGVGVFRAVRFEAY